MTCQVGPAAQPAGQTMPVTTSTGYTWDLQPTTNVDTSGTVTSTTTTSYDTKDRATTVATSVSGLASSQSVPAITTSYDDPTGDVTGTSSSAGSTAMTFDNWGRQLTYTNTPAGQSADSSTTTYDTNGYTSSVVDNNGQTAYTYDGTDAAGLSEHRGMVTAIKVKVTGGTEYTSTGAYDQAGDLTLEKLPGNLIRRTSIDVAGEQTNLDINGQGINPDTGTSDPDQPWLGWATLSNAKSQIVGENTPDNTDIGASTATDRAYSYDQAGRLTQVQDHTGTPDTNGIVPAKPAPTASTPTATGPDKTPSPPLATVAAPAPAEPAKRGPTTPQTGPPPEPTPPAPTFTTNSAVKAASPPPMPLIPAWELSTLAITTPTASILLTKEPLAPVAAKPVIPLTASTDDSSNLPKPTLGQRFFRGTILMPVTIQPGRVTLAQAVTP